MVLIRVSGCTSILGNTGPMFLSTYGGKEVLVLPREKGGVGRTGAVQCSMHWPKCREGE